MCGKMAPEYVNTWERIETHKPKRCPFCPSCSFLMVSESLVLENRNNSLCFPSPALQRLGTKEGNGAYHKSALPCTTPSPRELFVIWGTCNNMWKRSVKICKERQETLDCACLTYQIQELCWHNSKLKNNITRSQVAWGCQGRDLRPRTEQH